jgi:transcriptional regulator GlxA family with amidase domain
VHFEASFVVDGKYITSVGGAASYEPALYLVERLYSREYAVRTAKGLVIDWDLRKVAHFVAGNKN